MQVIITKESVDDMEGSENTWNLLLFAFIMVENLPS